MSRTFERVVKPRASGRCPGPTSARRCASCSASSTCRTSPSCRSAALGRTWSGEASAMLVDLPAEWGPQRLAVRRQPGSRPAAGPGLAARGPRRRRGSRRRVAADRSRCRCPARGRLLAETELTSGHRAVRDQGAVRDMVASLAEGVGLHLAEVRRRLPRYRSSWTSTSRRCPRCWRARCPRPSGRGRVAAVEESVVQSRAVDASSARRSRAAGVGAHCCADKPAGRAALATRRRCAVARPGRGRRRGGRGTGQVLEAGVDPDRRRRAVDARRSRTVGRRR